MAKLKDSTRKQLIDIILRKDNVENNQRKEIADLKDIVNKQAKKINATEELNDNLHFDKDALKYKIKILKRYIKVFKYIIVFELIALISYIVYKCC